ncbi:MAG: TlpA disulfide reductase family protein [Sulfurifustis sp.]
MAPRTDTDIASKPARPARWRRRASPLVVLALIAALTGVATALLPTPKPPPPADLSLALLDGRVLHLAELRGRPVLVAFWATSCSPCVEEQPDLARFYQEFRPRGLEMLAIAMPYDPPVQVQSFVREREVPYPVVLDVAGLAWRAFDEVKFVPSAFLLDPQGRIVWEHVGKLDVERARRAIDPFLTRLAGS